MYIQLFSPHLHKATLTIFNLFTLIRLFISQFKSRWLSWISFTMQIHWNILSRSISIILQTKNLLNLTADSKLTKMHLKSSKTSFSYNLRKSKLIRKIDNHESTRKKKWLCITPPTRKEYLQMAEQIFLRQDVENVRLVFQPKTT